MSDTYDVNLTMSVLIFCETTCMTAKALYSGSAMWRMLKISRSIESSRFMKLYGSGISRYGGRGWLLPKLDESIDSSVVIRWEVGLMLAINLPVVRNVC